jgi:hypothetical protein
MHPRSIRARVLALFEKHRSEPGSPYDESHFLDYLTANPEGKRAKTANSFRALRRYRAFIRDVQEEFAICFSLRDRDAGCSVDKFVEKVEARTYSLRASLAAVRFQRKSGAGWCGIIALDCILLVIGSKAMGTGVEWGVLGIAVWVNGWCVRSALRERAYLARLQARIESRRNRPEDFSTDGQT